METNKWFTTLGLAALSLLLIGTVFALNRTSPVPPDSGGQNPEASEFLPYGAVTLRIGEEALFEDVRITPLEIVEDSRCPADVVCIQMGTLRVRTEIVSGLGTSTDNIALGGFITTEAEKVGFTAAEPYPMSSDPLKEDEYRLTYTVTKRPSEELNP